MPALSYGVMFGETRILWLPKKVAVGVKVVRHLSKFNILMK
jgi:hypothetical protein